MNDNQLERHHSSLRSTLPVPNLPPEQITIDVAGQGVKRDYAGLLEYWQMVRRHKGAVILTTCLGALGGFLLTLSEPRIYQSKTTVEIQSLNQDFLNMKGVNATVETGMSGLEADIQTQVKILQSRALNERVLEKVALQPRPADLQPADRLGVWRKALRLNPPTDDEIWNEAIGTAARNVRVRSFGANHIVDVTCDSTNPQLAADFCNTLTGEFIEQNLEARWKSSEYTGEWLTRQLQDLKIKLEKQQEEMQSYASATKLIFTSEKTDADDTRLSDLQKELSVAQADRFAKQSKFEMASTSPPGALPDVLDDASLKDSQRALAELRARLAQLSITFTPSHPEVRRVQVQIDAIEGSLGDARANVVTRIRKDFEAAERREALLTSAYDLQARLVSSKSEETAHYSLLKRDVDATHLMYETLQQRLKEASIASALRANNIRVVDTADRPGSPYKPDVTQRAIYGLLLGLVVGTAFAVMRERADRTLQDPGDVSYYLGVSELGVVPIGELRAMSRIASKSNGLGLQSASDGSSARAGVGADKIELVSWDQKSSILAESFRTTLTSILFSHHTGERPRVIVLTSASPKEGKTTVVSNLSIALAQINQTVLLIDGDMRRPRLHSVFDLANGHGLSDLLLDKTPVDLQKLEATCQATSVPGLYVMTSGSSRSHASSLVHSPRLAELTSLARENFDTVIIDTPPMVNIADARVFARVGDALILVVRSGTTTRDAALLAKSRLAEDGTPILGTILNFWDPKTPGYSYYKYYDAGYYHYHDDDGHSDGGGNGGKAGRHASGQGHQNDEVGLGPGDDLVVSPVSYRTARTSAIERWIQVQRGKA